MVSPLCEVKEGAGAYASTTDGVDVTPAATITIRLADPNVASWSIQCITTDETNVAATIQSGLTIDSLNKTASFTAPAEGSALRFRSRVNGGIDGNGVARASYSTTFCIYTLTGGRRVIAADETTEGSSFGWIAGINDAIRNSTGGGNVTSETVSWSPTASPNGETQSTQLTFDTADDVESTALTIPIPNESLMHITATVIGRSVNSQHVIISDIQAAWSQTAGVVTEQLTPEAGGGDGDYGEPWDAFLDLDGTNARLRVIGSPANTVRWSLLVQAQIVSITVVP